VELAEARASLYAAEDALGGREAAWEQVLHAVAVGAGLDDGPVHPATTGWAAPGAEALLAPVHEGAVEGRAGSGTFYTPPWLVAWTLDRVLDRLDVEVPALLDPACGCGAFLVPAVRRLAARAGRRPVDVVHAVHGVDLDPVAVAVCRLLLRLAAPGLDAVAVAEQVRVGDGLTSSGVRPDLVVGNPPFLGQLRRRTARAGAGAGPAAYTDTSGLFLRHALETVASHGRVALVQPLSLLAARDAAPTRAAVSEAGALTDLWAAARPVFPGVDVLACVPVVERRAAQGPVRTWRGTPGPVLGPTLPLPPAGTEWGSLAAPAYDLPAVALTAPRGLLADLGPCTADFRDQYYGLVPHVRERDDLAADHAVAPLVTAGLIEPAATLWARTPTRFARRSWRAPVVDLASVRGDTGHPAGRKLARWAERRLVPKVLVGTQGRVLEAVVDEDGTWLPSVPVLTLTPPSDRLWHALAVLLAPPVAGHAAGRYLGAAMSPGSIKLSASQCGRLPLPIDTTAWDEGADLARTAQRAHDVGGHAVHEAALTRCAEVMTRAYGVDGEDAERVLSWWRGRLRLGPGPGVPGVAASDVDPEQL